MNELTHVDLFSGIGGFSLAWKWCGGTTIQMVEIDPFCQKVLNKNFPGVPIHDDIKTFKWTGARTFILTGGFPCQPFSRAKHGKKSNISDFSEDIVRHVGNINPRYAVIENVSEHIINRVERGIRNIGYGAFSRSYSSRQFGYDHLRHRWFCITYPNDKSEFQSRFDAKMAIVPSMEDYIWRFSNYRRTVRAAHGVHNRVDRLKSLGNAIVPQVAYEIMKAILAVEGILPEGLR